MSGPKFRDQPWEHPEWYDLHDKEWTAGTQREPEHYKELILALAPLTAEDHLLDIGAGTGKLARMIVEAYPRIGRVTLIEPNQDKLQLARERLSQMLDPAQISTACAALGEGNLPVPAGSASLVTVGSVLMPCMSLFDGPLQQAQAWLDRCLRELANLTTPDGHVVLLETLAAPWEQGEEAARRLNYGELSTMLQDVWTDVECRYRVRDRVVFFCSGTR